MKVAFISTVHGHQWPGSEYLWSECARTLLASGHQVLAAVSQDCRFAAGLSSLVERGLAVEYTRLQRSRWDRLTARFVKPFSKLRTFGPDLTVVSSGSAFDPVYQPGVAGLLGTSTIPFIFISHFNAETFWVDDPMRGIMSGIFQKARNAVFVSKDNLRITERQLGTAVPRAHVIVPPLNQNLPAPLPWPKQTEEQPLRMACVARLEPRWKGQDVIFEILADARWRQRNYVLNLFGQGAEEGYLRNLCQHYGLEGKVKFAGYLKPEQIWRDHHIQVLATRGEGGPMVVTEGMMSGRVSVTTRCGFNAEYITDGENGFLADFATPECFGRKLEEAWNRRAEWEAMGISAHHSIKQRMGDFNAPDRLLKLILTENRHPA